MRWTWLCLIACVYAAPSDPAASQPPQLVQPAPSAQLAAEIAAAAPDALYAVELVFAARSSVGEIRTVAAELAVPRVLAFVEHSAGRGIFVLGLGETYLADGAREYSECRALVAARATRDELAEVRIDEWPVARIHVYATAHTVRELLLGARLPAATIMSAYAQRPEHLRAVERSVREEASQPLVKPNDVDLPAHCARFVGRAAEPTLSRDFPRGFQPPAALPGESFTATAFRVLAALPPATAVTIDLKLAASGDLEQLAALVRDYDIRGMRAELVPAGAVQRLIVEAQLSNHGGSLESLRQRAQCQLRAAEGMHAITGDWRTDWISVSLTAANAARFLSYPNLAQATITGGDTLEALERLGVYYDGLATTVYQLPRSMPVPAGCSGVYEHGDFDEVGTVRMSPVAP